MIHRTLTDAQATPYPPESHSATQRTIVKVTLADGRTFYRTYFFCPYNHKCRSCKGASRAKYRGLRSKIPASGHTCTQCGNPFAGFVRRGVRRVGAGFEVFPDSFTSSGRLHGHSS